MRKLLIVFLIFITSARKIKHLPGLDFEIYSDQYAGYINISETQHMFYWLIESQNTPSIDPLVFWFNGGPGCSSLLGLLGENGPFMLNENGTFQRNEYAWSRIANVVYLESPVGVGFSFATNGNGPMNDLTTADKNYVAVKEFLKEFPQFRNHDIFLTGESYAGVYIPMLASRIIDGQNDYPINLKGVAIGNGAMSFKIRRLTSFTFGYSHGFIGLDEYARVFSFCCNGTLKTCKALNDIHCFPLNTFLHSKHVAIDMYDITQSCNITTFPTRSCKSHLTETLKKYLNTAEVREALHIPDIVHTWEPCKNLDYSAGELEMRSYVKKVVNNGVRVLLYYGDQDKICDFMMGQHFATSLNLKKHAAKSPWFFENKLAGYKTIYEGLTFTTIRGAGHFAPRSRPKQMLSVIQQFFNDRDI